VGVTGHQTIPLRAVGFIEANIERSLRTDRVDLVGVSSLAAGSDQVFARIVLRLGGQIHAVVPCANYEAAFGDTKALEEYRELLNSAAVVECLPHKGPSEEAFLDAGRRVVRRSDRLIAIWDGHAARGKGGTGDIVHYARKRGLGVEVIWPEGIQR